MPGLVLEPIEPESATVGYGLAGSRWLDAKVRIALDQRVTLDTGRPFPREGLLLLRRGMTRDGQKTTDEFRYERATTDDDDGSTSAEMFRVNLAMEEGAFDALINRLKACGIPTVHLYFSMHSNALTYAEGSPSQDVVFHAKLKIWEQIESATLTQSPFRPVVGS